MGSGDPEFSKTFSRRSKLYYHGGQPGMKISNRTRWKRKYSRLLGLDHDLEESIDFQQNFLSTLKKNMKVVVCKHSIASLISERNDIVSPAGLPLWCGKDVTVRDLDQNPLFYLLKDALRRPLSKDQFSESSLPEGLGKESKSLENENPVVEGLFAIQEFITMFPPSFPNRADRRYDGKRKKGHGVHHLAYWHAQGHEHEPAMLSRDMLGRGVSKKATAVQQFLKRFRKVLQAVSVLFEWIDAPNYSRYESLFQYCVKEGAASVMQSTRRNCFMGMSVLTGVCVNPHRDSKDPLCGWAVNMAFGNFKGGFLEVPQIGYKFEVQPGDVVFMRSGLLQHSVSDTTSGLRFGVVLYTHQANFDERKRAEKEKMLLRLKEVQKKYKKSGSNHSDRQMKTLLDKSLEFKARRSGVYWVDSIDVVLGFQKANARTEAFRCAIKVKGRL